MSSSSSSSSSDSGSDSDNSEDTYVTVDSSANKTKTSTPNRQMNKAQAFIHKANISAGKIQTMCKLHMGRKRLRAMCSAAWEMVMDNESGDYFYRKMATGEIRWDKPSFYEAPEGSITDKTNQSASELLKLANERLLHLRNNRPKVESTDWPIVLPSGNRYEGQIRQFGQKKPHGAGVMAYLLGGRYCGEFRGGRRHGWGTHVFPDGSSYEGEWVDDRITGMGVKCETNGTRYEGEWMMDEYQGIGIYLDARGTIYQGEWKEGNRHGHGVEYIFEEASDGRHDMLAGLWENNVFLNEDPRLCCDKIPFDQQATDEAKEQAYKVARKARALVKVVAENRSKANQARRRANDERKETQLTMDVKQLHNMAVSKRAKNSSKGVVNDPYTQFLESELASSHRKQKAAERRLKQTQRMATLAEQQWTEAASYNSTMANERNVAQEDAARSKKWKPTAEARWQNIAEMRDMLLQLRVALHVSKREEKKMDRKQVAALRKAETLQLKLNKTLTTVQRRTVGKLGKQLSNQHHRNNGHATMGGMGGMGGMSRGSSGPLPLPGFGGNSDGGRFGGSGGFTQGGAFEYPANTNSRFVTSRGGMTSAGSSIMGLSPPGSPNGGRAVTPGMGYRILPEGPLPGTPLYYSPVRDQNGRAVSPVHPSRRTPGDFNVKRRYGKSFQGYSNSRERRAASPTANAEWTNANVLDGEWEGWPEENRNSRQSRKKSRSKKGKRKKGSRGNATNAVAVFE